MREGGDFGGWCRNGSRWRWFAGGDDDNGAPWNHFQPYCLPTPEQQKDWNHCVSTPGRWVCLPMSMFLPWACPIMGCGGLAWLTRVLSIFSWLGIISNFNIIFNPAVAPMSSMEIYWQTIHHSTLCNLAEFSKYRIWGKYVEGTDNTLPALFKCWGLKNQCTNYNKPGREMDSQISLHPCTHALIY